MKQNEIDPGDVQFWKLPKSYVCFFVNSELPYIFLMAGWISFGKELFTRLNKVIWMAKQFWFSFGVKQEQYNKNNPIYGERFKIKKKLKRNLKKKLNTF